MYKKFIDVFNINKNMEERVLDGIGGTYYDDIDLEGHILGKSFPFAYFF